MKKLILLFGAFLFFIIKIEAQTVTDIDGNVYHTVTIGTQVWLKENLKVIHYRNGNSIPIGLDSSQWKNLLTGAYCNLNNDTANATIYGRLYNWYAVNDSRKICPTGWHVPTDTEWSILSTYLGGENVAGGKLKEIGTSHWLSPNKGATNETGFTALPGGYRNFHGIFFSNIGNWWSSTEYSNLAWCRYLSPAESILFKTKSLELMGYSVRCIKDHLTHNDPIEQDFIEIYPNPAINIIYISCVLKANIKIHFYNITGECVLQKELKTNHEMIDINFLPKGIYLIKLISPNGTVEKKLIKE